MATISVGKTKCGKAAGYNIQWYTGEKRHSFFVAASGKTALDAKEFFLTELLENDILCSPFHLASTNIHQESFAPSALPDFIATMTPSDFPNDSPRLFIPLFDWTRSFCYHRPVRRLGSPKFLTQLSMPAVPLHPGLLSDCLHLLLHH